MHFEVRGIKHPGGVTVLALDAVDEAHARLQASGQGYAVLGVKLKTARFLGHERFPLLSFSQQLVALTDAGLGLVEALQALSEKHQEGGVQNVLKQLLEHLYQGLTLSAALERCPGAFPPLYVATVRASEKTGNLGQALSRFIAYQAQVEVLKSKLVTASIYPVLLMLVGGSVTLFLLGYVVPKFTAIYADLGREQPVTSRMLMHLGGFLNQYGGTLAILALATVALAVYVALNPQLREPLLARLPRIPALSERLRVVQLARFYRTCGMLLKGGIPAVSALGMVRSLLHAGLRSNLDGALREVQEGKPLSTTMQAHGLTTPVALRMLRVGERTGDMGGMMERIATFHDEEITQWVDRTTRLFEPLLMVFIGLVIGIIVLSLYMPIFELAGSLQ